MGPLGTAEQLEEEEGDGIAGSHGSPVAVWVKRLDAIEARQQRMESLLEKIAKGLQSS
jgi:hypothetical protein